MEFSKNIALTPFSLEAVFDPEGYAVVWDKGVRLTHVEHAFLSNYIVSRGKALVEFGLSKPDFRLLAPSMRTLYDMAAGTFTVLNKYGDDALSAFKDNSDVYDEILKSGSEETPVKLIPAKCAVINDQLSYLYSISSSERLKNVVSALQEKIDVYTTISMAIDENKDADYPASLDVRCLRNGVQTPLNDVLEELGEKSAPVRDKLKSMASLGDIMAKVYNDGDIKDSMLLTVEEVGSFLAESETYESHGIACYVPSAWKKRNGRFSLFLGFGDPLKTRAGLDVNGLLHFDLKLELDGVPLRADDVRFLMEQTEDIFLFHGRWTRINRSELKRVLRLYDAAFRKNKNGISFMEAMRASFMPEKLIFPDIEPGEDLPIDFDSKNWFENVSKLAPRPSELQNVELEEGLAASLRPYQQDGLNWLYSMYKSKLGACLSDDMGLGKTLEALAFFEKLRQEGAKPSLIVIPASLLNNWKNEIEHFTPNIRAKLLHASTTDMLKPEPGTDLYITTYSMLQRLNWLFDKKWECVLLDEAQAIKNPMTRQSRLVKRLNAGFRIVMTGTPIENSPLDLWSIFQFLNPGFLGESSAFMENEFGTEDEYAENVRKLVSPFILRRLKTDKSVISDLPDKIEMKRYCRLTEKQAALYEKIISNLKNTIGEYDGIKRRGVVLSNILQLKQVCNHPDQFLKRGDFSPEDSGKFKELRELCKSISDMGENVLVFTQFRQMCEPLENMLANVFKKKGLVIHGGVSVNERGKIVERFNDPNEDIPFLVLSLRTAGVGLNLTAASHVIHFDRWWNPAVEDQATDRAFRIGQTRNVIVHKLICEGTLEEKIDRLIEGKRTLAESIIKNESAITELNDSEILDLLSMDTAHEEKHNNFTC